MRVASKRRLGHVSCPYLDFLKLRLFSLLVGFESGSKFMIAIPVQNFKLTVRHFSLSAVPELLEVSECGRRLAVAGRATQATSELVYYLLPSKILAR
jgi:hypothetical protein